MTCHFHFHVTSIGKKESDDSTGAEGAGMWFCLGGQFPATSLSVQEEDIWWLVTVSDTIVSEEVLRLYLWDKWLRMTCFGATLREGK